MNPSDLDLLKSNPLCIRAFNERVHLKKEGKEWVGKCPFHSEKTPSLKVYLGSAGVYLYNCFGCGSSGNSVQFIEKFDKISFPEALSRLQKICGNEWQEKRQKVENTFKPVTSAAKEEPTKTFSLQQYAIFEKGLSESPAAQTWLAGRGISYETAKRLHTGFRQSIGALSRKPELADKGWLSFPCIEDGKVTAIKYRSIAEKEFARQSGMAKGDDSPMYNTDNIDPMGPLFIVEGEVDALTLEMAGYSSVSLLGAKIYPTPRIKDMLMTSDERFLAGDTDSTGADVMARLWADLTGRTYKLTWPDGCKDANDALKSVNWDVNKFRDLVQVLMKQARAVPMPGVYSLQEAMMNAGKSRVQDHPKRLRFPWPNVDNMANLLPGSVLSVSATNTGMGKSNLVLQTTLYNAIHFGDVVLNYQCEMSPEEVSQIVAAQTLFHDRNNLTATEYRAAAGKITNIKYFIGSDPTLRQADEVMDLIEAGVQRLGATIVVLDHLHFVCSNEENEIKAQDRTMTRLKNIARRYGCKVIVVMQPRKATQQTRGKRLHITDLKGSGANGDNSDSVMVLHRECVKIEDPDHPPQDTYDPVTEVHFLKTRSKGEGAVMWRLYFHGKMAMFKELSQEKEPGVAHHKNLVV